MTKSVESLLASARDAAARGLPRQALELTGQALALDPDSADTLLMQGRLYLRSGRLHEARHSLERAFRIRPDARLADELRSILEQLEDYEALLLHTDSVVARWPRDSRLRMSRSRVLASLGDFEGARAGYLAVLKIAPHHVDALCALVHAGHGDDAGGLERIEALRGASDPGSPDYFKLCYASARLLEGRSRFDQAFDRYREANERQAAAGGMDIGAKQRAVVTVMNDLGEDVLARFADRGHTSTRPVFIVGMPRSGTSLTEQVLSRHPEIHAIGERTFLGEVLRDLITAAPKTGGTLPEAIDSLGPDAWHRAGGRYLRRLDEIDTVSGRITDKLPANFALLPWIRLLLPGARIIHVHRHPLATLASCIRAPFADGLLSFTVENWARFFGLYEAVMTRWRPLLGENMLEVAYEDLVGDLPTQARRMLDFLGLDWDEACRHPEDARRAVRTASVEQVRHGVHTRSVARWNRYRSQLEGLEPLIRESREFILSRAGD